jgi:hypothetical protein
METIKIKLGQIFELDAEINGISSTNESGEQVILMKGFINESLSLTTKYWLLELNKEVNKVKSSLESLRDELIKKYGTEDPETGKIIIPLYLPGTEELNEHGKVINGTTNPVYIDFQKEYSDLMNDDLEIQYKPIPLSILSRIETESVYPFILQNLITTE